MRGAAKPGETRPARRARLFVVGPADFAPEVAADCLAQIGAGSQRPDAESALREVDAATLGLILAIDPALPQASLRAREDLERIAQHPVARRLHRFAVVPALRPALLAQELYRNGVTAVFEWPGEQRALPHLLLELLATAPAGPQTGDLDRVLGRAVRSRLHLLLAPGEDVRATARAGIVMLAGSTSSRERKEALQGALARVPGVRHVIAHQLGVGTGGCSDWGPGGLRGRSRAAPGRWR